METGHGYEPPKTERSRRYYGAGHGMDDAIYAQCSCPSCLNRVAFPVAQVGAIIDSAADLLGDFNALAAQVTILHYTEHFR